MMMLRRTLLVAALAAMMPMGLALAAQINLDVQGHGTVDTNNPDDTDWIDPAADGLLALQNFSDVWNTYTNTGNPLALNDTAGAASGITFSVPAGAVGSGVKNNAQLGGSAPFDDMARDNIFVGGTGGVGYELTGLATDGTTYDLYVISANIWEGGWADVGVTHAGGTTVKQLTNVNPGGVQYTGGPVVLGDQYEEFLGILPDANGKISGFVRDFDNGAGQKYFSGLQLVSHPIPEPSSFVLGGLACLACFFARRRK